MDKTEIYIKMCDCPEIQEHRKGAKQFEHGDLVANYEQYKKKKFVGVVMWEPKDQIVKRELAVWLPRQDQVQEMMGYPILYCLRMLYMKFKPGFEPDSFEQLWLAFYMHELHGKKWDGKKWIKK